MVSFLLNEINPHSLRLINISAIRSGLCSFLVITLQLMILTMMNIVAHRVKRIIFFPIDEIKGHNDTPFIRIDFYIILHGFKMIQHYDDRSGSISPKMKMLEIRGVMEIISKINVDMVLSFS